jgi:hypothetical protein
MAITGFAAAVCHNPADSAFGGVYVLTTKEGAVFEIGGRDGKLRRVTDPLNTLTFSAGGIASSAGTRVSFGRDPLGGLPR